MKHHTFFADIKAVLTTFGINCHKIFSESFSSGVNAYSFYTTDKVSEEIWSKCKDAVGAMMILPKGGKEFNSLKAAVKNKVLTGGEAVYLYSAARFTYYFLHEVIEDFEELYKHLKHNPV